MKNRQYKKFFKYVFILVWMIIIFKFSQDPADISNSKSGIVIDTLTSIGINVNSYFGELTNFVVRKMGHLTEYFILALLCINAFKENFKIKTSYILAVLTVFIYACSDEFHQLYVPGRSGKFTDVLIDSFGGVLAVLCFILWRIYKKKNTKDY
ncbi:VanZ family protein [Clostridium rectalis]|uniref:VanZ family protein n=1 Tax=Clostridium rectalis TaxID=2040295 RepID=UPI000F640E65|nr:VanZ family protein [Clostridium rectalis]